MDKRLKCWNNGKMSFCSVYLVFSYSILFCWQQRSLDCFPMDLIPCLFLSPQPFFPQTLEKCFERHPDGRQPERVGRRGDAQHQEIPSKLAKDALLLGSWLRGDGTPENPPEFSFFFWTASRSVWIGHLGFGISAREEENFTEGAWSCNVKDTHLRFSPLPRLGVLGRGWKRSFSGVFFRSGSGGELGKDAMKNTPRTTEGARKLQNSRQEEVRQNSQGP